jgi:hypothetical protein
MLFQFIELIPHAFPIVCLHHIGTPLVPLD